MGKKAPAAPPAPDYKGAAEATAAADLNMARYATQANRINQYTPTGSLTYNKSSELDQGAYDRAMADWQASGAKESDRPNQNNFYYDNWTQTETYSPEVQRALNAQLAIDSGKSEAALGMLDRAKNSYMTDFNPTRLSSYLSGVNGVNNDPLGRVGEFNSDAQVNTDVQGALTGVQALDQNAPQYDPSRANEYARAAYEAQLALMRPDMDKQDTAINNRLSLQGLMPGSEASRNALSSYELAKAARLNSLAASSYLTGNQAARSDFDSQLSGFRAGNEAKQNAYAQALQTYLSGNDAELQKYGLDAGKYATGIQGLTANAGLQEAENRAQAQDYAQALNNYGTNWQQEQTLRNLPLNELNALLTGAQVQNPQFEGYNTQGQTSGANYLGAANAQGQYDMNAYNQQVASTNARNALLGQILGSAAGMFKFGGK